MDKKEVHKSLYREALVQLHMVACLETHILHGFQS